MDNPVPMTIRACALAAMQHRGQTRKDAARTPYINHPLQVAAMLATVGGVSDPDILIAAVLHDVIEDTPYTLEQIRAEFGGRVADLVAECTDDKSLPKEERKRLQIEHAPHKSTGAKLIKIADKTANVGDVAAAEWPAERKREYLAWAEKVVAGLRGVNGPLDQAFDAALQRARATLA